MAYSFNLIHRIPVKVKLECGNIWGKSCSATVPKQRFNAGGAYQRIIIEYLRRNAVDNWEFANSVTFVYWTRHRRWCLCHESTLRRNMARWDPDLYDHTFRDTHSILQLARRNWSASSAYHCKLSNGTFAQQNSMLGSAGEAWASRLIQGQGRRRKTHSVGDSPYCCLYLCACDSITRSRSCPRHYGHGLPTSSWNCQFALWRDTSIWRSFFWSAGFCVYSRSDFWHPKREARL